MGPTLFSLYTNDLPGAIKSTMTFMYVNDTIIYCIGDSVDEVIVKLNIGLVDLIIWCKQNSLIPHPKKCEGMILNRRIYSLGPAKLGLGGAHYQLVASL